VPAKSPIEIDMEPMTKREGFAPKLKHAPSSKIKWPRSWGHFIVKGR
jgi:hypothetical protein